MLEKPVVRAVLAIVAVLAIIALLAYARGSPGVGGRYPDPESTRPGALSVPGAPTSSGATV